MVQAGVEPAKSDALHEVQVCYEAKHRTLKSVGQKAVPVRFWPAAAFMAAHAYSMVMLSRNRQNWRELNRKASHDDDRI